MSSISTITENKMLPLSHSFSNHTQPLTGRMTFVSHRGDNYVIADSPCNENLHLYIKQFQEFNVTDVVRVCTRTYDDHKVKQAGISIHDMIFPDGCNPPDSVVNKWLMLLKSKISSPENTLVGTIAIHCVAGLGRAPLLVAIALVERGMKPLDAVDFIRSKRRGAFSTQQLRYISSYKRKGRLPNHPVSPLPSIHGSSKDLVSLQEKGLSLGSLGRKLSKIFGKEDKRSNSGEILQEPEKKYNL